MNILRKEIFQTITVVLMCSAICYSQNITSDFAQALEKIPQQPKWPSGIMFYDVQDAVDSFISMHSNTETVRFLQNKIQDQNSRKLALLSLAKLAASNEAAESVLYDLIHSQSHLRQDAITALAYLEPDDGRRIAENLLNQPGPYEARKPAVDILIRIGDQDTLDMLKQMQPEEESSVVRKALELAIPLLEYRLTEVALDKQAQRVQQETLCWRTLRETPPSLNGLEAYHKAAKTLSMQGQQFPRDYLEYKLNSSNLLGIAIISNQKETWAIDGLKKYATGKGSLGDLARSSLVEIGTSEALRALEHSLIPGGHRYANRHIMRILRLHGDQASAELAKKLASDERFSDDERNSLRITYEIIEKRLARVHQP